jgi:hypothetical protein
MTCAVLTSWVRIFLLFQGQGVDEQAWKFADDWSKEEMAVIQAIKIEIYHDKVALALRLTLACGKQTMT